MIKKLLLSSLLLLGCSGDTNSQFAIFGGGSIDLQSPQKLVLINYWAVWCAPCRKEIPEFNELAAEHADQVTVLAVNFDGSQGEQLREEMDKLGIEFSSLLADPRARWGLDPVAVLPETLLISKEGKLLKRLIGPQTKATLEALL
ncbi:MAG: TlpA family protein disulfide reductase [Porticoccaceae bacterium]|jgi:thiol-disulfide isomerase/thioredoxin